MVPADITFKETEDRMIRVSLKQAIQSCMRDHYEVFYVWIRNLGWDSSLVSNPEDYKNDGCDCKGRLGGRES